jgi:cardiolipin synthase
VNLSAVKASHATGDPRSEPLDLPPIPNAAHDARARWTPGNRFTLLENGEEFFPAVFDAIANAEREVILETFILFEDKVGKGLHEVLLAAAKRGVQVDVLVDGFGSPDLSAEFIGSLTDAGVRLRVFDPRPPTLGIRTNWFRRMHRKIVVVDAARAFVGGINYSADHLADFGPEAKQDYAVEVRGPLVADIHRFVRAAIRAPAGPRRWFARRGAAGHGETASAGDAQALFVTRDNRGHRDDIERHYRVAIRSAKREIIIANAYFFPGYRLLKEMRKAARRGVNVQLILQGQPDMPIVKTAAGLLYDHLHRAGVHIHEYCKRPLHGKVAVVDDDWSTVGSSNLDPLSLSLNLEANVIVKDRAFNQHLRERLQDLIAHSCTEVVPESGPKRSLWHIVRSFFVFHFLRRFPAWAGWLPAHAPALVMSQDLPPRPAAAAPAPTPAPDAAPERQAMEHGV